MIKTKVAFLEGRLFPANQDFLKTFQIALIGWINDIKLVLFHWLDKILCHWLDKSWPSNHANRLIVYYTVI